MFRLDAIGMDRLTRLENHIRQLGKVVVAFSGGVDSALLAFVSRKILGKEHVIAVTGDSASVPSRDRAYVQEFCGRYDIVHRFLKTYEYDNPDYKSNPSNRCFFCKEELYHRLNEYARLHGYPHILDGTNTTDLKGHRPGFAALQAAGILAPYVTLDIDKTVIREMAAHLNLEVANKPQSACLASRIPTGTSIDLQALQTVDAAENWLRELGIFNPRVRFHGDLARLELKREEWEVCLEKRAVIFQKFQALGFQFVTLDLKEYERPG